MLLLWTSEFDVSALDAKGHWDTLEELLKVIGRYLLRYESVLKSCKNEVGPVLKLYISFATKYLVLDPDNILEWNRFTVEQRQV